MTIIERLLTREQIDALEEERARLGDHDPARAALLDAEIQKLEDRLRTQQRRRQSHSDAGAPANDR